MGFGRPRTYNDPEEFEEDVASFFEGKDLKTQRVTLGDLAEHLSMPVRTLHHYSTQPGYSEVHERARDLIENQRNHMLFDGKVPTAGVIFDLVNNYGWKQPAQIQHSGNIGLSHSQVPADVQAALDEHEKEIDGE